MTKVVRASCISGLAVPPLGACSLTIRMCGFLDGDAGCCRPSVRWCAQAPSSSSCGSSSAVERNLAKVEAARSRLAFRSIRMPLAGEPDLMLRRRPTTEGSGAFAWRSQVAAVWKTLNTVRQLAWPPVLQTGEMGSKPIRQASQVRSLPAAPRNTRLPGAIGRRACLRSTMFRVRLSGKAPAYPGGPACAEACGRLGTGGMAPSVIDHGGRGTRTFHHQRNRHG